MKAINAFLLASVLLFATGTGFAQLNSIPEKAVLKSIQKQRWEKALTRISKLLEKDSTNTLAVHLKSMYFFAAANPGYHLDSALLYSLRSFELWSQASRRNRERMLKLSIDSAALIRHRSQIDSAAFERARELNTESAYISFISLHPWAAQVQESIDLRNEVAYVAALAENTYMAFDKFIKKYPDAKQVGEARSNYHRLLFEARTRDRRLASYQSFLQEYPESPYRTQIEREIFELYTASGQPERFLSFLGKYPRSPFVRRAENILYHLVAESDESAAVPVLSNDSLRRITELNRGYLVPFLKGGRFGFMDHQGHEIIRPSLQELNEVYRCGAIQEDFIVADNRMIARDGSTFFSGNVEEVDDLGAGFLKISQGKCVRILHKSGFHVDSCVVDAKLLGNRYLALRNEKGWALFTVAGRQLFMDRWDEVEMINQVLVLHDEKKTFLIPPEELLRMFDHQKLSYPDPVTSIKAFGEKLVLIKKGKQEGLFDVNLRPVVPFGTHQISSEFFGISVAGEKSSRLLSRDLARSIVVDRYVAADPWLIGRLHAGFSIINRETLAIDSANTYDSVRVVGPFLLADRADTLWIHFSNGSRLAFKQPVSAEFLPGKDSISFLALGQAESKTIFDNHGLKLFSLKNGFADNVQYAGEGHFIVAKKEKKGLINGFGKTVLPIEYDAIGSITKSGVTLLKSMKFGFFRPSSAEIIKPMYDKNATPYNDQLLVTFKDGKFGFIDRKNKPFGRFEYEEIRYWTDSAAWLKKEGKWTLLNLFNSLLIEEEVTDIVMVRESPDEKLAIVKKNNLYGVLSSKNGVVIPISFTDLVNLGTAEDPFYFTEKHVSEASIFVVIYYDARGKFVRREVYENPDDYEQIYCADN